MALRRVGRWLLICTAVIAFYYFYISFKVPIHRSAIPPLKYRKSSHDWSEWKPYYPISSSITLPTSGRRKIPRIQAKRKRQSRSDVALQEERRAYVKSVLAKAWHNYRELAWMRDELTPVTGNGIDTFGGWAATAVDALDTLWIMDLKAEFYHAARAVVELDWANTNSTACNVFETTIRHLGGLLAAHGLSKEPALLEKAVELGDMLYSAFDTPNHMPPFWLDYEKAKSGRLIADDHQPAASVGSLSLEFSHLAQLTGDDKYYDIVARITDRLFESQNETSIPGIWPTFFNLQDNDFVGGKRESYTLGALSDSLYEYLPKMDLLLTGTTSKYEQMWRTASQTLIQNVIYRPMTPDNLDILLSGTSVTLKNGSILLNPEGQHLACFAGGMFALAGKIFDNPEHVDIGARLTKGCIWAYDAFPSGLMPEIFGTLPCNSFQGCTWDEQAWAESTLRDEVYGYLPKSFTHVRDPRYMLRPEALESVFILYRITGDEEYRNAAWRMFQNIVKATDTVYGNSAIDDVRAARTTKQDSQESFWFSETLKYAYLIFSPPEFINLDDYVLNTEAHPLKLRKS